MVCDILYIMLNICGGSEWLSCVYSKLPDLSAHLPASQFLLLQSTMGLLELPNELLIFIADYLGYANLNSLCRVNRQLHNILNHYLYQRHIQQDDSDVMQWAAIHGCMATLRKVLQYSKLPR